MSSIKSLKDSGKKINIIKEEDGSFASFVRKIIKKNISSLSMADKWNLARFYSLETSKVLSDDWNEVLVQLDDVINKRMKMSEMVENMTESFGGLEMIYGFWRKRVKEIYGD